MNRRPNAIIRPQPTSRRGEDGAPQRTHRGSLRSKLVLSVAALFFAFLAIHELVRHYAVEPEFVALERQDAARNAFRVRSAISVEAKHLQELANQVARCSQGGADFTEKQLSSLAKDQAEMSNPVPWLLVSHPDGRNRWYGLLPAKQDDGNASVKSRRETMAELLTRCRRATELRCSGLTRAFDGSVALFAAAPLHSESPTTATGETTSTSSQLILGRPIDSRFQETIRKRTQVPFTIQRGNREPTKRLTMRPLDESTLLVDAPLPGEGSEPIGQITLRVPRAITSRAAQTTALARHLFILGATAAIVLLLLLLQRIVVAPIVAIRKHTDRIAERGLAAEPLVLKRNDEIGELAEAFDNMTRRLSDAQQRAWISSRAAGASQVADTVIHNIGNVLTNVNSLVDTVRVRVRGFRFPSLKRLAERLQTSIDDREFLEATPDYLRTLADSLARDQSSLNHSLATLSRNLSHIHEVIRDQRQFTRPGNVSEELVVNDLIRAAVDCCQATLEQDDVAVEFAGDLDATIVSDRSILLQVFVNVVANAGQALRETETADRKLVIGVTACEETIVVAFQDTGVGMNTETLARVFDAHFTTRAQGSGLGLHFCALAARRLGGSLSAASDGPGRGATFLLTLPAAPPIGPGHAVIASSDSSFTPTPAGA